MCVCLARCLAPVLIQTGMYTLAGSFKSYVPKNGLIIPIPTDFRISFGEAPSSTVLYKFGLPHRRPAEISGGHSIGHFFLCLDGAMENRCWMMRSQWK